MSSSMRIDHLDAFEMESLAFGLAASFCHPTRSWNSTSFSLELGSSFHSVHTPCRSFLPSFSIDTDRVFKGTRFTMINHDGSLHPPL